MKRIPQVSSLTPARALRIFVTVFLLALSCASISAAVPRVALLSLGDNSTARLVEQELVRALKADPNLRSVDRDLALAAAKGSGYDGSLNLTIEEAKTLGAAIGCDLFITGDAQTIRRTSSARPKYFEAYASIFIVNARTGQLIMWDRPHVEENDASAAERALVSEIGTRAASYFQALMKSVEEDRSERAGDAIKRGLAFEQAPEDEKAAAQVGIRLPQPYRRLRPEYPRSAAEADAEATVDLLVDIGPDGEVAGIKVARWAGFGLDDAAINTVRKLHFRPAMRNGVPFPIEVLLRYNFRSPPKERSGDGENR
jgi:TonB family protein